MFTAAIAAGAFTARKVSFHDVGAASRHRCLPSLPTPLRSKADDVKGHAIDRTVCPTGLTAPNNSRDAAPMQTC
jgi:hypothetical protein